MFDQIITVALNPSLDVTLWIDSVDFNEPVHCLREKIYAGGKAINVSRVLKNLGINATLACITGEQNQKMLTTLLDQDEVDYRLVVTDGIIRENMSILLPDGKMLKINRKGTPAGRDSYRRLLEILDDLVKKNAKTLVLFAGSLPPDFSKDAYRQFILQVKEKGAQIAIDSDVFTAADLKEIRPYLIKPNLLEARALLEIETEDDATVIEKMKQVSSYVEHILLSMGGSGMAYLHKGTAVRLGVPKVAVKSTVGAGDTTLAGFIAAVEQGASALDAAKFACACGTASVTLEGTEAITAPMISPYLPLITVSE